MSIESITGANPKGGSGLFHSQRSEAEVVKAEILKEAQVEADEPYEATRKRLRMMLKS